MDVGFPTRKESDEPDEKPDKEIGGGKYEKERPIQRSDRKRDGIGKADGNDFRRNFTEEENDAGSEEQGDGDGLVAGKAEGRCGSDSYDRGERGNRDGRKGCPNEVDDEEAFRIFLNGGKRSRSGLPKLFEGFELVSRNRHEGKFGSREKREEDEKEKERY
jgi:hypothetical protein